MPEPVALVGLLVVCAALGYAVAPLVRPRRDPRGDRAAGLLRQALVQHAEEERLLDEREASIRALAELDFDRQLGNLAERDYQELRERYRNRAVATLRALDGHEPSLDRQIEQAVALHRVARREAGGRSVLAQRAAVQPRVPRRIGGHDLPEDISQSAIRRQVWVLIALGLALVFAAAVATFSMGRAVQSQAQASIASVESPRPRGLAGLGSALALASADGLLISQDLGDTWFPSADVPGEVQAMVASPMLESPAYLAAGGSVFRGSERGWERAGNAPSPQVVALAHGLAPSTVYAVSADGRIFRSTDRAATWAEQGSVTVTPTALAVLPGPPEALMLGTDGAGVLASTDQGRSWGEANGFANGLLTSTRVRALVYDPASGDSASGPDGRTYQGALYVGTDLGLARTIDAGSSWSRLPFRGDVLLLGAGLGDASNPAPLYVLDAQGNLYRSLDRGITWPAR